MTNVNDLTTTGTSSVTTIESDIINASDVTTVAPSSVSREVATTAYVHTLIENKYSTIKTKLDTIANAKASIKTAIEAKGVTVGTTKLSGYGNLVRAISGEKSKLKSTIVLHQTESNPSLRVTGAIGINGTPADNAIAWIKNRTHRYLCLYDNASEQLIAYQLSDTDSTKYANGSDADITTLGNDVMVHLPEFWYAITTRTTNQTLTEDVSAVFFNYKPDDDEYDGMLLYHWEGNDFIGAFEGYISGSKLYSSSGKTPTVLTIGDSLESDMTTPLNNAKLYAKNRSSKDSATSRDYSLVRITLHAMMSWLYIAYYGNTNSLATLGPGTASLTNTGQSTGKVDTSNKTASGFINFWGLENWWGNISEIMDGIEFRSVNSQLSLYEDLDLSVEYVSLWPSKYNSFEGGYMATAVSGGWLECVDSSDKILLMLNNSSYTASSSTYYCDYLGNELYALMYVRSGAYNSPTGNPGVFALAGLGTTNKTEKTHFPLTSIGTRLAYKGDYQLVTDVWSPPSDWPNIEKTLTDNTSTNAKWIMLLSADVSNTMLITPVNGTFYGASTLITSDGQTITMSGSTELTITFADSGKTYSTTEGGYLRWMMGIASSTALNVQVYTATSTDSGRGMYSSLDCLNNIVRYMIFKNCTQITSPSISEILRSSLNTTGDNATGSPVGLETVKYINCTLTAGNRDWFAHKRVINSGSTFVGNQTIAAIECSLQTFKTLIDMMTGSYKFLFGNGWYVCLQTEELYDLDLSKFGANYAHGYFWSDLCTYNHILGISNMTLATSTISAMGTTSWKLPYGIRGISFTGIGQYTTNIVLTLCTNLSHKGAVNIINSLPTVSSTHTLTFSSVTKALLSSSEIAVGTNKGWTIS